MKVMKIEGRIKVCSFCGIPKLVFTILRDVVNREGFKFDLFICDECICRVGKIK